MDNIEKIVQVIDQKVTRRIEFINKTERPEEERTQLINNEFRSACDLFGITEEEYLTVSIND